MNWTDLTDGFQGSWTVLVHAAAAIATAAVLVGASSILVRMSARGAAHFATQPLRTAGRRIRRSVTATSSGVRDEFGSGELRRLHRAVITEVKRQLRRSVEVDPAVTVRELLTAASPVLRDEQLPHLTREFRALHELLTRAQAPEVRGLFVHYQVPELWTACSEHLAACVAYLDGFVDARPVVAAGSSFREFATAFSGAAVLADACAVQGGVLRSVKVFHRARWDGPEEDAVQHLARESGLTPYEAFHATDTAHAMRDRRVGQYDGRVPTLVAASVVEGPARAGADLLLVTDETCYATTEPPHGGRVADPPYACKGLMPAQNDLHMRKFGQRRPEEWTFTKVAGLGTRTVLLNVVLGLLAAPPGREPALLFAIRSKEPRNGAGGLAPAAGGVIELAAGRARKDSDAFGCVDPRAGVVRECREELGFEPDPDSLHPAAAFLSTTRSRPWALEGAAPPRIDTGELVASVLFLGSTDLDLEQVRDRVRRADPVEGAYESQGVVQVPMCGSAEELVRYLSTARFTGREVVAPRLGPVDALVAPLLDPFMGSVVGGERLLDALGQSGVLTCLYASARIHGADETRAAFQTLGPWWRPDWPGRVPDGTSRICRGFDTWLGLAPPDADGLLRRYWPEIGVADLHHRLGQP